MAWTRKQITGRHAALLSLTCCYAVLWIGGVAQSWHGVASANQRWLAALFLTLTAMIVLISARTRADLMSLIMIAALRFAVEFLGVHFEVPFGKYSYVTSH